MPPVVSNMNCNEDLAQLNAHQQDKEKHLEGADRAYFCLRNYREVSKNSYGLAGNADNALLGAALMRGEPLAPCSWKGGITYLAMDAGGSLRTPLVRANFAYFTRCLQTIPYWICNETTDIPACYFWNKERAASAFLQMLLN